MQQHKYRHCSIVNLARIQPQMVNFRSVQKLKPADESFKISRLNFNNRQNWWEMEFLLLPHIDHGPCFRMKAGLDIYTWSFKRNISILGNSHSRADCDGYCTDTLTRSTWREYDVRNYNITTGTIWTWWCEFIRAHIITTALRSRMTLDVSIWRT